MYEIYNDCVFFRYGPNECFYHKKLKKCKFKNQEISKCKHSISKTAKHKPAFKQDKRRWKSAFKTSARVLNDIFRGYERDITPRRIGNHRKRGHFQFIPRPVQDVVDMLMHARAYFKFDDYNSPEPKLLDCGCGMGNVVMLARAAGFDAYGIEYDAATLKKGKDLFRKINMDPKRLFKGDLLEFDKFGDYDVLYFYCPMHDGKLEHDFEDRLFLKMRVGALVIGGSPRGNVYTRDKERMVFQSLRMSSNSESWHSNNPIIKTSHEIFE